MEGEKGLGKFALEKCLDRGRNKQTNSQDFNIFKQSKEIRSSRQFVSLLV